MATMSIAQLESTAASNSTIQGYLAHKKTKIQGYLAHKKTPQRPKGNRVVDDDDFDCTARQHGCLELHVLGAARGTSPIRNSHPPWDDNRALGILLLCPRHIPTALAPAKQIRDTQLRGSENSYSLNASVQQPREAEVQSKKDIPKWELKSSRLFWGPING